MESNDLSNRRFLIVDDEKFMMGLLERALRKLGVSYILKAEDGSAALKLLADSAEVDCIISDMDMLPMNGLQFLKSVRTGDHPNIKRDQPFIMLTGNDSPDVAAAATNLDVNAFLAKPPTPQKLGDALKGIFLKTIALKDAALYRSVNL